MRDLQSIPSDLRTRRPDRFWGVTPASLYLGLCGVASGDSVQSAIRPVHRAETLRWNLSRDLELVADGVRTVLSAAGLVDGGEPTDLGVALLAADSPRDRLQAVLPVRLDGLRPFLREFRETGGEPLTRSDLQSLLPADDATVLVPLLGSLGYARITPDGAVPRESAVERSLTAVDAAQNSCQPATRLGILVDATTTLSPEIVAAVVTESEAVDSDVTPSTVGSTADLEVLAGVEPHVTPVDQLNDLVTAALGTATTEHQVFVDILASDGVETAGQNVSNLTEHLRNQFDAVDIDPDVSVFPGGTGDSDDRVGATATLLRGIAGTVDGIPPALAREFVGVSAYDLFRVLSESDVAVPTTDTDGVVRFDDLCVNPAEQDASATRAIRNCLAEQLGAAHQRRTVLSETTPAVSQSSRERISSTVFDELPSGAVEPVTFAFTLPDPQELGEETMADYTGDHGPLLQERARLDDWHRRQQPADARRFTELTDRIVNRGLRRDLDHQVLRIMTPYDDDTFAEFATGFRSLLREGFEIRLLTRHTRQRWQWERLRDNLLGELDENRDQVTVRTYSRYKQYGRVDFDSGDDDRSEFGIHAKLQTVGDATEGAALLGSANFMENSYHWNPECGAYTEQTQFVAAAINFFDVVWGLGSADEVSLDRLQEVPDRSLYPSYYS